jgi:hypothetical protein
MIEKVPEFLKNHVEADGSGIEHLNPWINYYTGSNEISLDGRFTVDQLRAMVDMIDANKNKT